MGTLKEAEKILGDAGRGEEEQRDRVIVRTSVIGILANIFLAAFKAVVGIFSHSIAIVLDAVNNLSDAASSVITIVGTKLAAKEPDRKHPYGYGRIEYFSAMIIAVIVLYAGVTSLVESIKKIIDPETPDYSALTILIVTAAVLVKVVLGVYVKKTGEKVNSDSLIASGKDAVLDSVISTATLVAALLFLTLHISVEAYLGAVISLVIIKAGYEMLMDTISDILGQRVDSELSKSIKKTVCEVDGVLGAYDLVLHNYGPDRLMGSVNIEVYDTKTADEIDAITRAIQDKVYHEYQVIIAAAGIYSVNTRNEEAARIRTDILRIVGEREELLQMHGFYLNEKTSTVTFDIIIDFDTKDREGVFERFVKEIEALYPAYTFRVTMDTDFSD